MGKLLHISWGVLSSISKLKVVSNTFEYSVFLYIMCSFKKKKKNTKRCFVTNFNYEYFDKFLSPVKIENKSQGFVHEHLLWCKTGRSYNFCLD